MAEPITAYDVKKREKVVMLNPKPLKFRDTRTGKWRYRLAGVSEDGTNLSRFVNEETAKEYGTPQEVAVKSKPKKTRTKGSQKKLPEEVEYDVDETTQTSASKNETTKTSTKKRTPPQRKRRGRRRK